jgi:hypothetical protein
MKKSPIIYFNGPFEPCDGVIKKKDRYKLNKQTVEILKEISRGAISGLEYLVNKSNRNLLGGIDSIGKK